MKKYALLLLLLPFLNAGCDEEPVEPVEQNAELNMTFKATYDGDLLDRTKNYNYGDYQIQFTRFTLFVTDVHLLKGTETVKLTDAEFMAFFPDVSSSNLSVTPSVKFADIPTGDYTGIRIGFGVKPNLNAKTPADFASTHALANEIEYWNGWKSYIFTKIEGQADINQNGNFDGSFNYHCGSFAAQNIEVFTQFDFAVPIKVQAPSSNLNVEIDLKKLFYDADGKLWDLKVQDNRFSGSKPSDWPNSMFLMKNYEKATSIKQ